MLVTVPLATADLPRAATGADVHAAYVEHFAGQHFVSVRPLNDMAALQDATFIDAEALNGTNRLEVFVFANDSRRQAIVIARLDNLGKGASGAAVQNINLMLGLPEAAGLD
jgi:N-acetyl-gamma-glutamyl-phosphate reductase